MEGPVASALAPRPFSRWVLLGALGVVAVTAADAAVTSLSALAASLAAVALLVALAGRLGDTLGVAALCLVATAVSGAWEGWGVAWGYALGTVSAYMALAGLVALLRSNAVTMTRRLGLLRDLLGLADEQLEVPALVDRVLDTLAPVFADACALDFGDQRLGVRGGDAGTGDRIELVLQARGTPFGRLSLALKPSGRRYSAADRAYADLVAGRVAVVLDNAGLTRQAAEAERRLVAALDTLGEAVTMNGPDGRTVYVNQAAVELLKAASAEELTSMEVSEFSARFAMFDEHGAPVALDRFPAFKALRGEDDPRRSSSATSYARRARSAGSSTR